MQRRTGSAKQLCCPLFPRVDKKRDKIERKILDSQERAFWDVHRPVVGEAVFFVIITEISRGCFWGRELPFSCVFRRQGRGTRRVPG